MPPRNVQNIASLEWPTGFTPESIVQNPRSTSGILTEANCESGKKLHFKTPTDRNLAGREILELRRVGDLSSQVNHIRPIRLSNVAFSEDAVVTELVDGESLFNYIWNGLRWWRRTSHARCPLVEIGTRVGEWLRVYHASSARLDANPGSLIQIVVNESRRKLMRLLDESNDLEASTADSIFRYLDGVASGADQSLAETTSQIHADLSLSNILIDGHGDLHVVDFADTRRGFPAEDVVRIWHDMWGIAQLSSRRKQALEPCMAALLRHAGFETSIADTPQGLLFRCWNAVCCVLATARCSRQIGLTAGLAARRISRANVAWLRRVSWDAAKTKWK